MSEIEIYSTTTIKTKRRTNTEMYNIKKSILTELKRRNPQTLRGLFYRVMSDSIIPKTENCYRTIARITKDMRLSGELPFHYLADNTRWVRKPDTYDGIASFLDDIHEAYRRDILKESGEYIEIWCEKDAIAGLLYEVASYYRVPVMVNRGYGSITFLYNAAKAIEAVGKPTYIYYYGDSDPSGKDIQRDTEEKLRRFAPGADIHFMRSAVTTEQIEAWELPSRPGKETDSTRTKTYTGPIVEVDAIPSYVSMGLVQDDITSHIDNGLLHRIMEIERMERDVLSEYFSQIKKLESEHSAN